MLAVVDLVSATLSYGEAKLSCFFVYFLWESVEVESDLMIQMTDL